MVNIAASGTAALNFSNGKYRGLGIPGVQMSCSTYIPPAKDRMPGWIYLNSSFKGFGCRR